MRFRDRGEAGRCLAGALGAVQGPDVVVLGLARGGVPVAAEVAQALHAPLDLLVVRKIGVPGRPELAMGAVGEDGVVVLDEETICSAGADVCAVSAAKRQAEAELADRVARLRAGRAPIALTGRTAIVVDDGIATGATARAACRVARLRGAARIVVAAPVGAPAAVEALTEVADQVVCPRRPAGFVAVGRYYVAFEATTDREVRALLAGAPGRAWQTV